MMCMEDIRIGRKTSARVGSVAVDVAAVPIVSGSRWRTHLTIAPANGVRVTISNSASVAIDAGITLPSGVDPFELDIQTHGDAVRMPWFAIASAPGTIGFIETLLTEE